MFLALQRHRMSKNDWMTAALSFIKNGEYSCILLSMVLHTSHPIHHSIHIIQRGAGRLLRSSVNNGLSQHSGKHVKGLFPQCWFHRDVLNPGVCSVTVVRQWWIAQNPFPRFYCLRKEVYEVMAYIYSEHLHTLTHHLHGNLMSLVLPIPFIPPSP